MPDRNWQEDWEICKSVTPGPWKVCEAQDGCGLVWSVPADFPVATTNTDSESDGIVSSKKRKLEDAGFIAEAREALPYWLQQVKELREENAVLRDLVTEIVGGVVFSDDRVAVVELQISRTALEDARNILSNGLPAKVLTVEGGRK